MGRLFFPFPAIPIFLVEFFAGLISGIPVWLARGLKLADNTPVMQILLPCCLLPCFCLLPISAAQCEQATTQTRRPNSNTRPTRAEPPDRWDPATENLFRGDPFQAVRGFRPKKNGTGATARASVVPERNARGLLPWSKLISEETVTDEIKNLQPEVAQNVRRPGTFKAGGNREVEKQFAVIAVMFGIIAEYGEPIRWQTVASDARDAFARAAANAKAGSQSAYQESKTRFEDLEELIRGGTVEFGTTQSEESGLWSQLVERRLLMQRIDRSDKERIKPWIANESEFKQHREPLLHEAEMIAALAEIFHQEDYEFYDDDDFVAYCKRLQKQAQELAGAIKNQNLPEVQKLYGDLNKTCSACHEIYK